MSSGPTSFVRPPADNTGKRSEASQVSENGDPLYRLRVEIPGEVSAGGDLLLLLLQERRATNVLLAQAFGLDIDDVRATVLEGE